MKKFLGVSFLIAFLLQNVVFAAEEGVVTLDRNSIEKPGIEIESTAKQLKGSLLVNDSETVAHLIEVQKEHDVKDLEKLWRGTV